MLDFRDVVLIVILIGFFSIVITWGIVVDKHKTLCDEQGVILLDDSFYKCEFLTVESNNV